MMMLEVDTFQPGVASDAFGIEERLTYQRSSKAFSRPSSSSLRSSSLRETLFLCANNRSRLSSASERSTADTRPQSRIGMSLGSHVHTKSRPSTAHVGRMCSDLRQSECMSKPPLSASVLEFACAGHNRQGPRNKKISRHRPHSSYGSHVQERQTIHEERGQRKRPMTSTGRSTDVLSDWFEVDLRKSWEGREESVTTENRNYISPRHSDRESDSDDSCPRLVQTCVAVPVHSREQSAHPVLYEM